MSQRVQVNSSLLSRLEQKTAIYGRIGYSQSADSFITCIEHRHAVVLFGFSGHDATLSLI